MAGMTTVGELPPDRSGGPQRQLLSDTVIGNSVAGRLKLAHSRESQFV